MVNWWVEFDSCFVSWDLCVLKTSPTYTTTSILDLETTSILETTFIRRPPSPQGLPLDYPHLRDYPLTTPTSGTTRTSGTSPHLWEHPPLGPLPPLGPPCFG